MAATMIDGKAVAARVRAEVAQEVAELGEVGLATVLVGDDPASHVYIESKHKAAHEAGMTPHDHKLPADITQDELLKTIADLNADDSVDGILVQLPLPDHLDEGQAVRALDPIKDVDGLHPTSAGQLFLGQPTFVPATPWGVMVLLEEVGVSLSGADAAVIGRSQLVGKPAAMLLQQANATVTMCHSRTRDLGEHLRRCDVVVAAVGVPELVKPEMIKPGAVVIDVGINRTEHGLVGDVDKSVAEVAGYLTPVPGGVGPMTIAMLMKNTVRAARFRRNLLEFPTR